jgi:hypothetical protein
METFTGETKAWRTGRRQYLSPDKTERQWFPISKQPPDWTWVGDKPKHVTFKDYTPDQWKQHIFERVLIHPITGCWIWQKAIRPDTLFSPVLI